MTEPFSETIPPFVPRVAVKFQDNVPIPYEDGAERSFSGRNAERWSQLWQRYPGITLQRQFTSLDPNRLNDLVRRATDLDPTYRPSNLLTHFAIECPPGIDPNALTKDLLDWPLVEAAYDEGPPMPPPAVTFSNNPRVQRQGYLNAAPDGIDAFFVWSNFGSGSAGEQIKFIDIEQGWLLTHEDLPNPSIQLDGHNHAYLDHGTAVLGIVIAVDNTRGIIGIACNTTAEVISEWRIDTDPHRKTADAISVAISKLELGDVLLLETEYTTENIPKQPTELQRAVYDVIRLATALGIVVIEPAGNNGLNLSDLSVFESDQPGSEGKTMKFVLDNKNRHFRDSGAIMVGAANSLTREKITLSNYGPRIDCFAWGDNVDTLVSTNASAYTNPPKFDGTSSAAAIIAGAALVIQSVLLQQRGYRLSPRQLRDVLSDSVLPTNTASQNPSSDLIGVMPNLRSIVQKQLGLLPEIYIRDHIGDIGLPHSGPLSASPDIILRSSTLTDPQKTYGEGSGTENMNTLGSPVLAGRNNYLYVRVRNRGSVAAEGVTATVYWTRVATLVTSDTWTEIGTVTFPIVAAGDQLTVSSALTWEAKSIPASDQYCFVALINHPQDPAPKPAAFRNFDDYVRFVRDNNNVSWHNFHVISPEPELGVQPPGFIRLPFWIAGAPDKEVSLRLEISAHLPIGSRLLFDLPTEAAKTLGVSSWNVEYDELGERLRLPVHPHGLGQIGEGVFPVGFQAEVHLLVAIPKEVWSHSFQLFARQMYGDQEIGRVTWYLSHPDRVQQAFTRVRRRRR